MSSDKKREASRKNAEKSSGPRSAAAKARTRFNAAKDRIFAGDHTLPGEDPKELEQILDGYFEYWEPVGEPEISLVRRMGGDEWRLRRSVRAEKACLESRRDKNNAPAGELAQPSYEQLVRLKTIVEKQIALLRQREGRATEEGSGAPDEGLIKQNEQRAELYAAILEGLAPATAGGRLSVIYERMESLERSLERKMAKLLDLQARRKKRRRP
jgi:hypothetical protein